jgi:prolipoprotein diacylglyceryltransferase
MFNKDEKDTVPGVKTGLYFYFLGFFRLTIDFLRPDSFLSFFSVSNYQKTHFSLCISLVTIYIGILVIIYLQENFNQKNQIGNQPINIKKI